MNEEILKIEIKNAVKEAMSEEDKKRIRKLQSDLQRIDNGERFFFNITQFRNMGLVTSKDVHYTDARGNDAISRTEWYLTPKAKEYLKILV
jgi:hypothetical protein